MDLPSIPPVVPATAVVYQPKFVLIKIDLPSQSGN